MASAFRDLRVWTLSLDLATTIYSLTTDFPPGEIYGLTSQMRRASVSIASNIAEGSGRRTKRDFSHFASIAHGSNCELQTQLIIARRLGFGSADKLDEAERLSHEVGKLLNGLLKYLRIEPPN